MGNEPPAAQTPTRVRYKVVAFLSAMTFILYLDRVCIGQAVPRIRAELGLSLTEIAFVSWAFTLAYGLFEVPAGRLCDRYGSRYVLALIVVWWSAFTIFTGLAAGLWMLLIVRFLFGAGEAGAVPNTIRILSRWFPDSTRGSAQGFVMTAMMIGGSVSPTLAAYLIELFDWRWTFGLFGSVGILWAVWFFLWFRDEPKDHPAANKAEVDYITTGRHEPAGGHGHAPIPWGLVVRSPNVWLLGGIMTCGAAIFYLVFSWFPTFLQSAHGSTPTEAGNLTSLVLAGGAIGGLLGGKLTDVLMARTGNPRVARCGIGRVAYLVGGGSMLLGLVAPSPLLAALCMGVAMLCVQIQIPAWWSVVVSISGRHVGSLSGLMNSMGVIGASVSQLYVGPAIDTLAQFDNPKGSYPPLEQWTLTLFPYVPVMVAGWAMWLFVRPDRTIEDATPSLHGPSPAVPDR